MRRLRDEGGMISAGSRPMPSDLVHAITLTCHPETRSDAVRSIGARVCRSRRGVLAITYTFEGELDRLRLPAPSQPRVVHGLWRHTCCEIFIARHGLAAYHEFNFSPSGEWAAYAFDGYRRDVPLLDGSNAKGLEPRMAVHGAAKKMELKVRIQLDRLSPMYPRARLSLALSAVVEDNGGSLSYWALKHPPGKPDFHHADAFALELA